MRLRFYTHLSGVKILHLRRKSDKKIVNVPMHYEHDVSKDGEIVNMISYHNAALLK